MPQARSDVLVSLDRLDEALSRMEAKLSDPQRLRSVRQVWETPPTRSRLDGICTEASAALRANTAITLVAEDAQHFLGACGYDDDRSAPSGDDRDLEHSYCQYVAGSGLPMEVRDSLKHPLVAHNLGTTEDDIRAYLGYPVFLDGEAIGAFCAWQDKTRRWTERDHHLVETYAKRTTLEFMR